METNQQPPTNIRFCLYARKSSESDERQAISINSQVKEMLAIAKRDNLAVGNIYKESHSAKKRGQRDIFNKLIAEIENDLYSGIITWSADRLSRNAGDLGVLIDLMDEEKLKLIITYSQTFTNNPNEKFLLMILGSQAKLENDNRSINIKRGIRNQCLLGYWPGPVPLGYFSKTVNGKRIIYIDSKRGKFITKIFQKVAASLPVKKLILWIRSGTSLRSKSGKQISKSTIYKMLRNPFYYGRFIYKGIEYQGNYKPLIPKELFDQVQAKLRPFRNTYSRTTDNYSLGEFLKCSICGSSVHRQTKHRKLKNGNTRTRIYYHCSKQKDKFCNVKYISEENVLQEIANLVESINLTQIRFPEEIKEEIAQFERMRWEIYKKMSGSQVKFSIYPLEFEAIDKETIRMYLQNMILYDKPSKKYYLISLLLKNFMEIKPLLL
ncbi:MAG: recombinase family protein [Candidatus Pacebacteria bacterium]|nr:recombinase family protein [Candidatus Paceibacterota bacterium]